MLVRHTKKEGKEKGQKPFSTFVSFLLLQNVFLEAARFPLTSHWSVLGYKPTNKPTTADQSLAKGKRAAVSDLNQL